MHAPRQLQFNTPIGSSSLLWSAVLLITVFSIPLHYQISKALQKEHILSVSERFFKSNAEALQKHLRSWLVVVNFEGLQFSFT